MYIICSLYIYVYLKEETVVRITVDDLRPLTPYLQENQPTLVARYNGKVKRHKDKYFGADIITRCPEGLLVRFREDGIMQRTAVFDIFNCP